MPKTIQVRDIDDSVYVALRQHAAEAGFTVPEYVRRLIINAAARPTLASWIERTRHRTSDLSHDSIMGALDQLRGPWPDDRR